MKNISIKKIILAILTLVIGYGSSLGINHLLIKAFPSLTENYYIKSFVTEALFTTIAIASILIVKKKSLLHFNRKDFLNGLKSAAPIIIYSALLILITMKDISQHTLIKGWEIILFVFNCLLIGIGEEALFRGAVQELTLDAFGTDTKKKQIIGIIVSSTLFGMMHFFNLIAGASFTSVFFQVLGAVAAGMVFGAICFRSGRSIWSVAFAHAILDFASFFNSGVLWGATQTEAINDISFGTIASTVLFIMLFIILMKGDASEADTTQSAEKAKRFKKTGLIIGIITASVVLFILLVFIPIIMTKF